MNQSRSDVYAVHVLAPEEIDPRLTGDLRLIDSETEHFAEITSSRALFRKYTKNRDGFVEEVRRYCTVRGVGHLSVSSDTPIERLTLDLLRQGGMVR